MTVKTILLDGERIAMKTALNVDGHNEVTADEVNAQGIDRIVSLGAKKA